MEEAKSRKRKIPFRRPVRVGNFKVVRRSVDVGSGRGVAAIVVSDLEGLWSVQIPSTIMLFGVLTELYSTGEDADEGIMHTMLCSLYLSSCISDGHFHKGLLLLSRAFMHPESLDDESFLGDVREAVAEYKDFVASRPSKTMTDEDYDTAEAADGIQHTK